MTGWEYKIEKLVPECGATNQGSFGIQRPLDTVAAIEKRLSVLGAEGWELVDVSPAPPDTCQPGVIALYYFKRPKPLVGAPGPGRF